ncbi:MAG TPA: response regulator [Tepidisphaeraceae bacterium]|jgi:diguanylate cyclase (GGDEF)-like protein|nr:response regulator [Tepidisphaeraceae bacterium]
MPHSVLLIDDSLPFHKLVKAYLEPDRITIHSVHDGEAGLAAAARYRPSLILLDIDMPRLDGFEVCRRLKADPVTESIPLIFLTASSMLNDTVNGLEMGASDYICKPFKPQQFRARIRATLRAKDHLDAATLIDESTGLWNRAYFDQHIGQYVSLAKRWGDSLACIVVELDDHSALIASHGQGAAGEMALAAARLIQSQCRAEDLMCRFAPNKFAILVTGAGRRGADHLATRLRGQIERRLNGGSGQSKPFSCSFGIADTQIADAASLADRAEAVLSHRTRTGPNRVIIARASREKALAC